MRKNRQSCLAPESLIVCPRHCEAQRAAAIYNQTTKPVINFLSKNINYHEIDGTLKIDEITSKIDEFINF